MYLDVCSPTLPSAHLTRTKSLSTFCFFFKKEKGAPILSLLAPFPFPKTLQQIRDKPSPY